MKRTILATFLTAAMLTSSGHAYANDLEKLGKGIIKVITKPVTMVPEVVFDALKGKDIGKSAQSHFHQFLDGHKHIAESAVDISNDAVREARRGVRKVGGNVLGDVVDLALEPTERLSRYAAALIGTGVELGKGKGLTSIPAELLAAELRLAETTLLPDASPLPDHVKRKLENQFEAKVLNHARYVVGNRFSTNVAQLLNSAEKLAGVTNAVTVGRVIVFESEPGSNYRWWAHELGHVEQYMELGFSEFARRYVKSRSAIERDADRRAGL